MIRAAGVIILILAVGFLIAGWRDYRRIIAIRDAERDRTWWTEDEL